MFMKLFFRISAIAVVSTLFACGSMVAQAEPTVSTIYTVEQIDQMYKDHKMARPQDTYPPQNISTKFAADFQNTRDIDWEKSNSLYEVEFEVGREDYTAYYDMDGNLVMYECESYENQLPAVVKNAALSKYPNFRFDDVDKIVKGKETSYKVELKKGKLDIKIRLKDDGTIINEYFD